MSKNDNHLEQVKSLDSKLEMMDIASELRKNGEEAKQNLDIHLIKQDIKKTILETAKIRGEDLTEEQVDTAIDTKLSEMYKFQTPEKNLNTKLADAYVDRKRLSKKYGIPSLITIGAGIILWSGLNFFGDMYRKSAETNVEQEVLKAYKMELTTINNLQSINNYDPQFITDRELDKIVNDAIIRINKNKGFFEKYCPDGNPDKVITQENYSAVENKLEVVKQNITESTNITDKGTEKVGLDRILVESKNGMDAQMKVIDKGDLPSYIIKTANDHYNRGLAALKELNKDKAATYKFELEELGMNVSAVSKLSSEGQEIYYSIWTVSKEMVDIKPLNGNINELKNLDNYIHKDLNIKIVTREDVLSGIDRYYTDDSGKRNAGWYLIVEAKDKNGIVQTRRITSKENGRTRNVTMWGERIPEYIYERVKSDKIDDGMIEDDLFAVKEVGYINDKIVMKDNSGKPLTNLGQITEW